MPKPPRNRSWFQRRGSKLPSQARGSGARFTNPGAQADHALLHGFHAASAALANPSREIRRVLVTEAAAPRLAGALEARGLEATIVEARDLDKQLGTDTVHQGMLVEAEFLAEPGLDELCVPAPNGSPPLVLVLDQVTDPHNVGAILRSAAVFGVSGLIMTRQHSPPLSGVLAKAASGALELIPVALVTNLARAMEELADLGVFRIGLDGDAAEVLETQSAAGPAALVLGAEGKGLRRLTRENCDMLCRISTFGQLRSLNVSNAAAVALHTLRTARARLG